MGNCLKKLINIIFGTKSSTNNQIEMPLIEAPIKYQLLDIKKQLKDESQCTIISLNKSKPEILMERKNKNLNFKIKRNSSDFLCHTPNAISMTDINVDNNEKIKHWNTARNNEEQTEIIMEKIEKKFCKIYLTNGGFCSGFFCLIPFPNKLNQLNVLFINSNLLNANDIKNGEIIKLTLENDKIKKNIIIDDTRKIYTNKNLDITIIEIKKSDKINPLFFKIDYTLFESSTEEKNLEGKEIYITQYQGDGKYLLSQGTIEKISKNDIQYSYSCLTKKGYSGNGILFLLNFNVIGIHKEGKKYDFNQGTLIKVPIKEFINKFHNNKINSGINIKNEYNKNYLINNFVNVNEVEEIQNKEVEDNNKNNIIKNNQNKNENNKVFNNTKNDEKNNIQNNNIYSNEKNIQNCNQYNNQGFYHENKIIIKINIEKFDTNHEVFFLNNVHRFDCSKNDETKSELPNQNIKLLINEKPEKFKKYFIPENEGTYNIEISFLNPLTNCSHMFSNCNKINEIDLSSFNSQNITNTSHMFYNCYNLSNIILSNLNTKKVTDMSFMFSGCNKLKNINLINFITQNTINMENMFCDCYNLTQINLNHFNTKNVINMQKMFKNCHKLTNIDLSNFNTSNIISMNSMFQGCENLTSIDLSFFNTTKVTNMENLFMNCKNLKDINLLFLNTKKVIKMKNMFNGCQKLENIDLSDFNTFNVINMENMFEKCINLIELDLTSFNIENVESLEYFCFNCKNLNKVDLSSFNFKENANIDSMFYGCSHLRRIKVNKQTYQKVENECVNNVGLTIFESLV